MNISWPLLKYLLGSDSNGSTDRDGVGIAETFLTCHFEQSFNFENAHRFFFRHFEFIKLDICLSWLLLKGFGNWNLLWDVISTTCYHDIKPLKSLPSRLIWLSTGLSTKWATKVVYDACKIQIGQPCLPAILLNTVLLDSALIHFSCPDSSPLSKHLIGDSFQLEHFPKM